MDHHNNILEQNLQFCSSMNDLINIMLKAQNSLLAAFRFQQCLNDNIYVIIVAIGVAVWHFRSRDDAGEMYSSLSSCFCFARTLIRKESPWNSFSQTCSPKAKQHKYE